MQHGLRDLRVIDFSSQIAGPYATKLMADAGADVIKIEPPEGDPMRRWSATGADLGGRDAALFRFLHHSKRSILGGPDDAETRALIEGADLVVEDFDPRQSPAADWVRDFPGLVVLSITPYGHTGPWARRPSSEFILQAESGSIGGRGLPGGEPFQAGGRMTEWVGGTFASVGALAAVWRARNRGHGEHVDFSLLEVMNLAASLFMDLVFSVLGRPELPGPLQGAETPSIEPTTDGYVGFNTNSFAQFSNFLDMIGRPDLKADTQLATVPGRASRFFEWNEIVRAFTIQHSTEELIKAASSLRIPVAPICNGDTVRQHEHLKARGVFRKDPAGEFEYPRPPYRIGDCDPPPQRACPALGEHTGRVEAHSARRPKATTERALPLEGIRIVDMTAWWAGPAATQILAALGADVIHVESIQRPDGIRMASAGMPFEKWWESNAFFLTCNANKRGITLDMNAPRGVAIAKRLIATADGLVENFTPRVLENFGLDWETVHSANPNCIFVRMPAFGLEGPWRDRPGFAQTMEQMTGLAWVTGHADDQPRIQRGPCDPLAGMHAAFAFLVALEERKATGCGQHVECTMVEGALNAAAEQVIEYSAYGNLLGRQGNRAPEAAPQGLYPCRGSETYPQWLALSVATDAQWRALCRVLGDPAWAQENGFASLSGRREGHDLIDAELKAYFADRDLDVTVERLIAAGVPAGSVLQPNKGSFHPQLSARGFFERIEHSDAGEHPVQTVPFRYASVDRWLRQPAPSLGQHNREILGELGLDAEEIQTLEDDGVIGYRPQKS